MNFIAIAVGKCCWSLKVKPCRSQDLMQNSKLWWSYLARRCQLRVEYCRFYGRKQKMQKSLNKKETYIIMIFIFHSWIIHVNGCASAFLDSRIPLLNRWSTSLPRLTNSLWCFLPTALVETKCVGDKTKNAERHTLKHWKQLCCLLIPWWSLWIFVFWWSSYTSVVWEFMACSCTTLSGTRKGKSAQAPKCGMAKFSFAHRLLHSETLWKCIRSAAWVCCSLGWSLKIQTLTLIQPNRLTRFWTFVFTWSRASDTSKALSSTVNGDPSWLT